LSILKGLLNNVFIFLQIMGGNVHTLFALFVSLRHDKNHAKLNPRRKIKMNKTNLKQANFNKKYGSGMPIFRKISEILAILLQEEWIIRTAEQDYQA